MAIRFFRTAADSRRWLAANHTRETELQVEFHKSLTKIPSLTWTASVDQAIFFGWIDGVRKRIDDISYTIRFTPRKPNSIWSNVNLKRAAAQSRMGLMQPAGIKAFQAPKKDNTGKYFCKSKREVFDSPTLKKFSAHVQAFKFFQAQAPSYRKLCIH
jgi:uncharacterized protein YdeI (YjbR/CyaY-like superfamily)